MVNPPETLQSNTVQYSPEDEWVELSSIVEGISDPELVEQTRADIYKELHENWRGDIQKGFEDKGESPETARLRASKDKSGVQDAEWFQTQEAQGVVFALDDAGNKLVNTNVAYEDLPPSWQEANKGAGDFVVDGVVSAMELGSDITTDEYIESESSRVHDKWMADNSWQAESTPELFVPYAELPEDEKKKDRDQVLLAVAKLTQHA